MKATIPLSGRDWSPLGDDASDVRVEGLSNSGEAKKRGRKPGFEHSPETCSKMRAAWRRRAGLRSGAAFDPISGSLPDDFDETGF